MRIAVIILGIALAVICGLDSYHAYQVYTLIDDKSDAALASIGLLSAVLFIIGSAFVLNYPRVAVVGFFFGGIIAFGGSSAAGDLPIYGIAGLCLAFLSILGYRELRRVRRTQ